MLNPKEKCAVFIDIDGTLISGSHIITERNLKAISNARKKGHLVFINTGRSFGNIPDDIYEQFQPDGIVCASGAMVFMNGETIYKTRMSESLVRRVMEYIFENRQLWAIFEGLHGVYSVPNEIRKCRGKQILVESPLDSKKICEQDEIQVIAIGAEAPEDFKEMFRDEITVLQFETYADCIVKGYNKAIGMEKVLELTGIKRENTIAIGDSDNDYDMIKYAGIGVAMGNSQRHILKAADYITTTAEDSGVAVVIEELLLDCKEK